MTRAGAPISAMAGPTDVHHIFLPEQTRPVHLLPVGNTVMKHQMTTIAEVWDLMAFQTGRVTFSGQPFRIR